MSQLCCAGCGTDVPVHTYGRSERGTCPACGVVTIRAAWVAGTERRQVRRRSGCTVPEFVRTDPSLSSTDRDIFCTLDVLRRGADQFEVLQQAIADAHGGVSTRTVMRSIKKLRAMGAVKEIATYRDVASGKTRRTANRYVLAGDEPFPVPERGIQGLHHHRIG